MDKECLLVNYAQYMSARRCPVDRLKVISLACVIDFKIYAQKNVIQDYFDVLESAIEKNKLDDKPHVIFDFDESAFVLDNDVILICFPPKLTHLLQPW